MKTKENLIGNAKINLVDFGFASEYIDKETSGHIPKSEVEVFRGNMIFSSLN